MKKNTFHSILFFAFLTILMISCKNLNKQDQNEKEDSLSAVKAAIHSTIGWAKNKDFDLLYSIIANDPDYLEVDPEPGLIRGFEEFKKNELTWASPDFKAIRYDIRDLKIDLSEQGNVAWFYCILDDINEWKGQPACWMNTRWTGVLEKRDGKWIMVQMHFSFAKD
jgi:ketosteroid isomerase-like protein